MESKRKKITTAVIAGVTAVALMIGGTFAWQSISQTALNEKEAVINPGGRLHDDFNGTNKDVYVENFADDDIFARVRLNEYFEITMNRNVTGAEKTEVITTGATKGDTSTYLTHKFGEDNATDDYWQWITGGSTVYMPTFNKNKDSLKADINGTFENDYTDYVEYELDSDPVTADATYDNDSNSVEDDGVTTVEETHYAKETAEGTLISMEEWKDDYNSEPGNYWVYDTDGWIYWASPIKSNTATGLLLDAIELKNVMDDSYYYAIEVTGQFITADDLGKDNNTGFYDTDAGSAPSKDALTLLEKIGVDVGDTADDDNDGDDDIETQNAEVQIALYNEDGTKVAGHGAGSTLAANSTYDIVATVSTQSGDYVVSDSRSESNVSNNIKVETCNIETVAYDSTSNYINSDGQLVTGNDDTFDHSEVSTNIYKSLSLKATVSGITVGNKTNYTDTETEYNLYPTGKEVFTWENKWHNFNGTPVKKTMGDMKILDGNKKDITTTGNFTFEVEGANSKNTKLEMVDGSVVFTLGDDETAEEVYLVASNKNGKAREVMWIIYSGTIKIGDTTLTPYPMDNMQTIDISKSNGVELTCYDYWGNKVETEDITYTIDDYILTRFPNAYVENGKLYVSEIKTPNYFMLKAKYPSAKWTISYNFKVNLTD